MKSNAPNPREVALTAVMTAAVAAVTMVISVPFPLTRGYFNFRDAIVMLAGLLFGARLGGFVGGIGSALADVFSGYPYYAPLTLLIKGTEGFLTGLIGNNKRFPVKVAAVTVGAVTMLVGYFAVETPLYGMGQLARNFWPLTRSKSYLVRSSHCLWLRSFSKPTPR